MHQYYGNYDTDVINIGGSGKITPDKTMIKYNNFDTQSVMFKPSVEYMPPLEKITNKGNKIKTNTLIDPNNFVKEDLNSNNYYYTAQQMQNVNIINKDKANSDVGFLLNIENPIQSPPALVTTTPEESRRQIKSKIRKRVLDRIEQNVRKKMIDQNLETETRIKQGISDKQNDEYLKKIANEIKNNKAWITDHNLYATEFSKDINLPWLTTEYIVNLNQEYKQDIDDVNDNLYNNNIDNFQNIQEQNNINDKNIDLSLIMLCIILFIIIMIYLITRKET